MLERPAAGRLNLAWKTVNDYNKHIATRLARLAASSSTGFLPITGPAAGGVYFRDGRIVYAESARTLPPAEPALAPAPLAPAPPAPAPLAPAKRPATTAAVDGDVSQPPPQFAAIVEVGESTIDAALDLLSSRSTCARFRPARVPPVGSTLSIAVDDLLAEVMRRRRLLKQMATVTADTAVARTTKLAAQRVQVSALDWALLIRVRTGTTPRDLARELRRSVFATTTDVHRLIGLGLLSVGDPHGRSKLVTLPHAMRLASVQAQPATVSFIQALSDQKGGTAMTRASKSVTRRQGGSQPQGHDRDQHRAHDAHDRAHDAHDRAHDADDSGQPRGQGSPA
jgi:hypothetical protein